MDGVVAEHPDALDRALLDRHVSGDPAAFSELVRRHQGRLWAVALRSIVVNACLDRARRQQSRPTVPLPEDDRHPATGDALANRELATDLSRALATLPVEQRMAVVLVDAQGYPLDEVARLLSVPVGTVKSRCSRGRARLALLLRDPQAGDGNLGRSPGVQPPDQHGAQAAGPETGPTTEQGGELT
jgi:RNA polymerase sigma-70 factor (ECF subfamily)